MDTDFTAGNGGIKRWKAKSWEERVICIGKRNPRGLRVSWAIAAQKRQTRRHLGAARAQLARALRGNFARRISAKKRDRIMAGQNHF
jgi:hypothetical protein